MKLTDTQLVLLSTASQRDDGAVVLAPNLRGGAASKVVGKLLRDGLIESVGSKVAAPPDAEVIVAQKGFGFLIGNLGAIGSYDAMYAVVLRVTTRMSALGVTAAGAQTPPATSTGARRTPTAASRSSG